MKKMSGVLISVLFFGLETTYAAVKNPVKAPSDFDFIVNSDIHQTETTSRKDCQLNSMIADIKNPANNTKAVILAGDLTDNGSDAEFAVFSKNWMTPIKSLMQAEPHSGLYLCKGNHDELSGSNTQELNYLKSEYGQGKRFYYSFDIEGLHFICCEKFPMKPLLPGCGCGVIDDVLAWLADDLASVGKRTPVIILFHYNILDNNPNSFGDYCDISLGSWIIRSSAESKKLFYDVINGYNIQGIFYGHLHWTYSALWQSSLCENPATDPKYRVADVGGSSDTAGNYYAFCHYHANTGIVDITFKDPAGDDTPWNTLIQTGMTEN